MIIKTEHLSFNELGDINASHTIRNSLNAFIQAKALKDGLMVLDVGFNAEDALSFTMHLTFSNQQTDILPTLFYLCSKLDLSNHWSVHTNTETSTACVKLQNPAAIIQLFKKLGYESLLTDPDVCLSGQVDLLQLLIADGLRTVFTSKPHTNFSLERIEFDHYGNLYAIITETSSKKYMLKNTNEIGGFLQQYCGYAVPSNFIALLREQVKLSTLRYLRDMTQLTEEGIPLVFSENKLVKPMLSAAKKQLSFELAKRNSREDAIETQERRIFQTVLSQQLGRTFKLDWTSNGLNYRLIIQAKTSPLEKAAVLHLKQVLQKNRLATDQELDSLILDHLIGLSDTSANLIPDAIQNILACKILMDLPDGLPSITPHGYSYSTQAIMQHLENSQTDPMNREPLTSKQLRPNLLLQQLIDYYSAPSADLDLHTHIPALLINPDTGQLYQDPVVTIDGRTQDANYSFAYPNRCIADLIRHFQAELVPIEHGITRVGIRATIGANIGLLCPGTNVLKIEDAQDETNIHLPYADYDSLTDTLVVHFISYEYARRLELGLNRYQQDDKTPFATKITLEASQSIKTVPYLNGESRKLTFQARILISGSDLISLLIRLCGLTADYIQGLKALSSTQDMDILNHIICTKPLSIFRDRDQDWYDDYFFDDRYLASSSTTSQRSTILGMRSRADTINMSQSQTSQITARARFFSTMNDSDSSTSERAAKSLRS